MFSKKAAIELSMNTLVIIIISLVILGSGITLLYKFVGGAEDLKGKLDERTNTELEHLLVDQGKQVALPLQTADIIAGEDHTFGIGILNIDATNFGDQFSITVTVAKIIDSLGIDQTLPPNSEKALSWVLYNSEPLTIKENDHASSGILVSIPLDAPKGQYIYNVNVMAKGKQYGNTQKMIVNVK